MTNANTEQAKSEPHANDRILREIRTKMGVDATLLKYFDLDKVRVKPFEDRKRERPTALPVRIHFGMIKVCCSLSTSVQIATIDYHRRKVA
jgi:hypothetical protein